MAHFRKAYFDPGIGTDTGSRHGGETNGSLCCPGEEGEKQQPRVLASPGLRSAAVRSCCPAFKTAPCTFTEKALELALEGTPFFPLAPFLEM